MLPNSKPYTVEEHTWDTCPADLWPLVQDWIIRERETIRLQVAA